MPQSIYFSHARLGSYQNEWGETHNSTVDGYTEICQIGFPFTELDLCMTTGISHLQS